MILKDKTSYFEVKILENSELFDKISDEKEPFETQNASLTNFLTVTKVALFIALLSITAIVSYDDETHTIQYLHLLKIWKN